MTSMPVTTPPTIGLSDREMEIVGHSLALRKVDLVGLREFCKKTGARQEQTRYAGEILELDLLRCKLGFMRADEETER